MDTQALIDILDTEQIAPASNVTAMCDKIKARHPERVQAFLYYGSSLRAMNDPDKMLDFYVLVDSYGKTHKNPIRGFLNWLIPPAVYYLENTNEDGSLSTCKYSIISIKSFEKKCTRRAFLSVVWGRFSQPCVLLFAKDHATYTRIQTARSHAINTLASRTRPLFGTTANATDFWARGFRESYRTELRPEKSDTRSTEIVTRFQERYDKIFANLYGVEYVSNESGETALPACASTQTLLCKLGWFGRRVFGKVMAATRILNSAATFDGGLDYALHKLKSHSGVTIEVTESQRKHPVLWSPVLAWKLYKRGAFR